MIMAIEKIKDKILPVLKKYGVRRASLFGSTVKGIATVDSDVDILVEVERSMSLLDFAGLKLELEEVLGRKVDLGEYDAIKPIIKDLILSEQVVIL
jgi:predicted nucleotidyltransferase